MRKFEYTCSCDCGNVFAWRFVKLDNGDCWFGKQEERILNCIDFRETANIYSFRIKCPNCKKLHFVTINK